MSYLHAIILGALQGMTELFPISSLGHSVLLPHILHWNIDESSNYFLIFLVATHLATSLMLFVFYRKDWVKIISGMFRSLKEREISDKNPYGKLGWLLVVGTIPAGILGLLFEDKLQALFASPIPVSLFLMLNGILLLSVEFLKKRKINSSEKSAEEIAKITWAQSVKIGLWQCLALLPGFSRTGSTLGGSLIEGLEYSNAAYFSFLLATPIIFAAAVLKLPELAGNYPTKDILTILIGSLFAAIAAYVSVQYLSNYFKTKTLRPFGYYCLIAGALCLLFFIL